jgi:spore coat polysaccharide biosynthesis predicted glycosyltransferase SpsG
MCARPAGGGLRILVLVDAHPGVGWGHLMRTRALLEALAGRRFLSVACAGRFSAHEKSLVRSWRYTILGSGGPRLRELQAAVARWRPQICIFDAYRPLERELSLAAASGARIVLFDDQESAGTTPVTLRICATPEARRRSRPRPAVRHLLGPGFLCLRRDIEALRAARRRRARAGVGGGRGQGRSQVAVGGAAVRGAHALRPAVLVSLGAGAGDETRTLVSRLRARLPWVRFRWVGSGGIREPRKVAAAMAAADAAVSAAGTTAWELAFLGTPAVVWTKVRNQLPIARAVEGKAALWCRRGRDLGAALARLLADEGLARRLSRGGRRLVDGRGARRTARALLRALEVPGGRVKESRSR